jgi:CHASE2 domain-containing sensor protein
MFRLPRDVLIGFLLVCAAGWILMETRALRFADQAFYDAQIGWLRAHSPTPLAQDVVVIGIDEAAYVAIPEPTALWHARLGTLFAGLSAAEPAVVGLALPLPVRSYDFLVKDIDAALISGIYRLKLTAPLVVGQPPGIGGRLRPLAPELLAAIGEKDLASLAICEDTDGVVRRINQRRCQSGRQARSAGAGDGQAPRAPGLAQRHDRLQRRRQHRVHPLPHGDGLDSSRR